MKTNILLLILLAVFSFLVAASASILDTSKQYATGEACNEYVDNILRDLKEDKEYFQDPYEIKGKTISLHKKVLFINYTGEATITDGYIFGLSSLSREHDVIVDKKRTTHLKVYLGAGVLKMNGDATVKLMNHGPKVKIDAVISYVSMKLDFVVNATSGTNPKVANFDIEEMKGAKIDVSGLGPLNFIINGFVTILSTFFKRMVENSVESAIQRFLKDKFNDYIVPPECLGTA